MQILFSQQRDSAIVTKNEPENVYNFKKKILIGRQQQGTIYNKDWASTVGLSGE